MKVKSFSYATATTSTHSFLQVAAAEETVSHPLRVLKMIHHIQAQDILRFPWCKFLCSVLDGFIVSLFFMKGLRLSIRRLVPAVVYVEAVKHAFGLRKGSAIPLDIPDLYNTGVT